MKCILCSRISRLPYGCKRNLVQPEGASDSHRIIATARSPNRQSDDSGFWTGANESLDLMPTGCTYCTQGRNVKNLGVLRVKHTQTGSAVRGYVRGASIGVERVGRLRKYGDELIYGLILLVLLEGETDTQAPVTVECLWRGKI